MKTFRNYGIMIITLLSLAFISSCGGGDDNDDLSINNPNSGQDDSGQGNNYNPNSDHALRLCLERKGYGSLTTKDAETALVGSWMVVDQCLAYTQNLEYNSSCDDYVYGYKFLSDGTCYYIDEGGTVETSAHSWKIVKGTYEDDIDMLSVYWRGTDNDRQYLQWTTKGYLIMTIHGWPCWKIFKRF